MAEVGAEPRIEPRRVLTALGFAKVSNVERVPGGWDTLMWRFVTQDGRELSLRMFHLRRRQDVAWRERVALETFARAKLPAPRVEAVGEVEGVPAMVLSWCPGRTILSSLENRPWLVWRLGWLFGRTQARLHAVAPPEEFVAEAPDSWLSLVDEEHADLADCVRALQPVTTSLIHMDFHPLNVVSDGSAITGIIDWASAAAGDPRADLARTVFTMQAMPVPPGPLSSVLSLGRGLLLRAWHSGYKEAVGVMPDYRPFMAWAGATLLSGMDLVIDRPGVWGTTRDMERMRQLVHRWAL